MCTLRLDIDETTFEQQLVGILTRGGANMQTAVVTALKDGFSRNLEPLVNSGTCLRYAFKGGGQSRIRSLKEAVERDGFDFWYLDVEIDLKPGIIISERDVLRPSVVRWLPIDYGSGVPRTFKFKHVPMKTRERYKLQILHPQVPAAMLEAVLRHFESGCRCRSEHLVPIQSEPWEWRLPFGCVICGKRYFCGCFRIAIEKSQALDKQQDFREADCDARREFAEADPSVCYREGICHLCTGTPSRLMYCSPMYGSAIKVRYGAYIDKFAIAGDLSARDAENRVRDILGVPRIGEGWLSETQLFNLVRSLLADYEVVREARMEWLGNQRIDIFVPGISLAIEYQGEQHFEPVTLFGGESGFRETRLRDKRKRQLCREHGVKLVYFTHAEELSVEHVEKKLRPFLLDQRSSR